MGKIISGFLLILYFVFWGVEGYAQLSSGGVPPGFADNQALRGSLASMQLLPPDYELLKRQDDSVSWMGVPERMGVSLVANITTANAGLWSEIGNQRVWRLNIRVQGATGLGFYFKDFRLAAGDRLFVYSEDRSHLIGAFTELNNRANGLFATEPVKGESVILELVQSTDQNADHLKDIDQQKKNTGQNSESGMESFFRINEIMVVYTPMSFSPLRAEEALRETKGIKGDSDECEVSTNCPEGNNWRDQINGVVRIMVKIDGTAYWCTGSLMNNTKLDFRPLILTADHCALSNGVYASVYDVSQWIFFFRHEATSCEDDTPVGTKSLTGAVRLASSFAAGNNGSDFYLMELNDAIPGNYQPYYQGWNAQNELSNSGVSIHHPAGDVKKISTYTKPLELSQWGDTPETHLMVQWSATANGHGVTEGGSSGSPLFNSNKQVIGQLTGGESDCTNLSGQDHYGRVFYSWDKVGSADSVRLKPWLDPMGTGLLTLDGSYNTKAAIAQFTADEIVIPVGSYARFIDLSINQPTQWSWTFEGGEPGTSEVQQPAPVYFDKPGRYDITLFVSNEFGSDTARVEISVVPVIYPNPARSAVNILFGNDKNGHEITISDMAGRQVALINTPEQTSKYEFSFVTMPAGVYVISVKSPLGEEHYKVVYSPN